MAINSEQLIKCGGELPMTIGVQLICLKFYEFRLGAAVQLRP
jgi:hypothetical protein